MAASLRGHRRGFPQSRTRSLRSEETRMLKKTLFVAGAVVALAMPAFAGVAMRAGKDKVVVRPVCFKDTEWQFDFFANFANHPNHGGWGGGMAINYFFSRYLGLGVEGNWAPNSKGDAITHRAIGNVFLRYPLELNDGRCCIAPYIFGGGGG